MKESDRLAAMGEALAPRGREDRALRGRLRDRGADAAPRRARSRRASTTASRCRMAVAQLFCGRRGGRARRRRLRRDELPVVLRRSSTGSAPAGRGARDHRAHRALRRPRPPGRATAARPQMQNAAFEAPRRSTPPTSRSPVAARAARRGASPAPTRSASSGLNVTVPHKQRRRRACEALDAVAREVGAVNTLRRTDARLARASTPTRRAASRSSRRPGVAAGRARAPRRAPAGAARAAAWALAPGGRGAAGRRAPAATPPRELARGARAARRRAARRGAAVRVGRRSRPRRTPRTSS